MVDPDGAWPEWLKKAAAVVAVAAVVVTATAVTVATCGAGSVAGVAMISTTATLAAKATEVTVLQIKKGRDEGDSATQIIKDSFESIYDNGAEIATSTLISKSAGIVANHTALTAVSKGLGLSNTVVDTLKFSSGIFGKVSASLGAALAWGQAIYASFVEDPDAYAKSRGYTLQ